MKKLVILIALVVFAIPFASAQKYMTKNGTIRFYSDGEIEKIEAFNHQVNSALDVSTDAFVFRVLIKAFEFKKALMQEHFNEDYMQSDKIPNATFNGKITNPGEINFSKDGVYKALIEGDLMIHGISHKIKTNGTFEVKEGKILGKSSFNLLLKDYNISVPAVVSRQIAQSILVDVNVELNKLEK